MLFRDRTRDIEHTNYVGIGRQFLRLNVQTCRDTSMRSVYVCRTPLFRFAFERRHVVDIFSFSHFVTFLMKYTLRKKPTTGMVRSFQRVRTFSAYVFFRIRDDVLRNAYAERSATSSAG